MDAQILNAAAFREQIKASRESFPHHWEASRKYMAPEIFQATLPGLLHCLQKCALEPALRERLLNALQHFAHPTGKDKGNRMLKELTGLPPSKAVRALMVWAMLAVEDREDREKLSGAQCEEFIRRTFNPYEVLRHTTTPSLLDIGAGDLSFEQELADQLIPHFRDRGIPLTVHAFDRLMPGSRTGGVYHKNVNCERYLVKFTPEELRFKFWGGKDLETFLSVKGALPRYTVSTCHAPANPTFAYEPGRLNSALIQAHLRASRGSYRVSRYKGEPVLEVDHRGQVLTFPPWKFEIVGPLALIRFMAQRSEVGILSAIDDEVFWEMLSQLLADERFRPMNEIFTKDRLPVIFGHVYEALTSMAAGERKDLSQLAVLRDPMPFDTAGESDHPRPCRFRYVEIRRGAVLEGIPSSFTARQFSKMKEESLPWWIIFVQDSSC